MAAMERLTERILLSVTLSQRTELQNRAKQARLSLTDYLRRKVLDQPMTDGEPVLSENQRLDALERRVASLEKAVQNKQHN